MSDVNVRNYIVEIIPVGAQGEPGEGVAAGGTTGQVLRKNTNANYDTYWSNGSGAIDSVNGQVGIVVLDADDVGAYSNTNPNGYVNISQVTAVGNVVSVNNASGVVLLDADDVGAYSNLNPSGYQNVSQVTAYANVISVNGETGIVTLNADDVGAYSNTNPAAYINIAQAINASPVQSVNGQTNVVVLDADDVGAYSNTNPAGYVNISQVSAVANVISVNNASGIVVLDADDVGAYSNLNPSGFINISQVTAVANVVSVNGASGIVVLDADDVGAYANTNPAGYQNVSQVTTYANVVNVNGKSGVVVLDANDVGAYLNTNPSGFVNVSQASAAAPVQSVNGQTNVVLLGLDDLSNVNVTVANTGDVLIYNATSNTWSAGEGGGGAVDSVNGQTGVVVLNMDDINDVQATNATEGQYLIYNSTSNTWQAKSVSAGGVQSVSGDGVDNSDPQNPVLSFPTLNQIGAYSNTNPAGYQNVSQVVTYANVVNVNGQSGVVLLDADDVGAYSNTNPSGYQNVSQVTAYANVINVNGQSGVVNVYNGGAQFQILAKNSGTDYDASWTSNINVDTVTFNTTTNATVGIAQIGWNFEEMTLEFGKTANTTLQIGQETLYPIAYNADSVTLTKGTVVMVDPTTPAQGNKIRIVRMVADGTLPAKLLVGLVTEDITAGADGFVTWFGNLRGISLSAKQPAGQTWADGDILWCDPAVSGGLTNVEPTAPNLKISVGAIVSINGNNVNVLVRPWLSDDLKDLHDVNAVGVTNGQTIIWNSTSNVWNTHNVVLGISGDGVNNTDPQRPTLTFPTLDQIGAYSNLNPAGYQNVTQVVSYANVVSVNGKDGVVALSLDDLTNVNVTSPTNGYVLTYLSTSNTWNAVESQGGGSAIDLGNIILNAQVFS